MRKLTREQKRDIAAIAGKKDEDIDFSDVPAVVDWSGAEIGKFYGPPEEACNHASGCGCSRMAEGVRQGISDKGQFVVEACHGQFQRESQFREINRSAAKEGSQVSLHRLMR